MQIIVTCLILFQSDNKEKLYFGYTKRHLKVFLSLVLLSFNDIMGYSAIAPFFPVVVSIHLNRIKKVVNQSCGEKIKFRMSFFTRF